MDKPKIKGERENGIRTGFTLVELLIVVAILAVLSGTAYIGIQRSQVRVMNEKVMDDLSAIENALNQYKQDNGTYPTPSITEPQLEANKNVLCFGEDLSYIHDCSKALFMQTQVDNDLLTKRYLQEVPTDPRTHSRYVYGVTSNGKYFQVAGNFEEDKGTWTARISGNLEGYPFLSGLIRAYNGPDFVVNNEGWLPYSPDHMSITATLTNIDGNVTIDDEPAFDGDSVESDSTIKTTSGSSAVLYFSDGSITYLDGTVDPNGATLRLLPNSKVEKNDKDSIITKIRLKLTSGKIWNKVARLAAESEFNVETTSAIAGVRGTEFGIEATDNKLTVFSGIVVARMKDGNELDLYAGTDQNMEFSSLAGSAVFLNPANQEAKGNDTDFREFDIGNSSASTGTISGSALTDIKTKYYSHTLGLSPADTPYIKKAESHVNGIYTLYITFNGFESDGTLQIDGFEIFGGSQKGSGIRSLKKDAVALLTVDNITYNPVEKAYTFDIDYKTQLGNPLYNQTESEMEPIVIKAFRIVNGKHVYSRLSWPLIGLTANQNQILTYEFDNSNVYQEFVGVAKMQAPQPTPIISGPLPNITLSGDIPLHASLSCDWSVHVGGGVFDGNFQSTQNTTYKPYDANMNMDNLITNVSGRFANNLTEQVTIRCTDPNDANNHSEESFTLTYEPWNKSNIGASYEYSWFAKVEPNWNQAVTDCAQLTEGNVPVNTWHLPKKIDLDPLHANANQTSLAETLLFCGIFGVDCGDMPDGVIGTWLFEDNGGNAWFLTGNNSIMVSMPKIQNDQYGFRCVK